MQPRWILLTVTAVAASGVLYFGTSRQSGSLRERAAENRDGISRANTLVRVGKEPPPELSREPANLLSANAYSKQEIEPNALVAVSVESLQESINADKATVQAALDRLEASADNLTDARMLLASPEGKLREAAGAFLAKTGTSDAVFLLLGAIKSERDPNVRENLMECLRHVSNPEAVPVLAEQARDLSDLALHRVCRNAMSDMSDPAAVTQLIEMLDKGGSDPSLEPIAFAVSHITSSNALGVLLVGAASENERVATACIQGLGNLASPESYAALLDLVARYDGTERSQIAAAVANQTALEKKDPRFVNVCFSIINTTSSIRAWQAAVDGLVAIPGVEALAALENQLRKERNSEIVAYLQVAIARHKKLWPAQTAGLGTIRAQ